MRTWGRTWDRTLARTTVAAALVALLGGCAFAPEGISGAPIGCKEINPKALKYVNWTQVPEVNLRISHDEFSPMVLRLRQGWPYILRIRNRDDRGHSFFAPDFFSKVAVVQASIAGKPADATCFAAIWAPPRETVELKLVAVTDGYYEFEDIYASVHEFLTVGPNGVIIVEERNPRI